MSASLSVAMLTEKHPRHLDCIEFPVVMDIDISFRKNISTARQYSIYHGHVFDFLIADKTCGLSHPNEGCHRSYNCLHEEAVCGAHGNEGIDLIILTRGCTLFESGFV
jgi:hypothetical protein